MAASKSLYFDIIGRDRGASAAMERIGRGLTAFGAATGIAVAAAVKSFADWDAKMAQVQSLSHAGVSDMDSLRKATFGFATDFGISASDAADAEIELVKGGVSIKDMINGGLSGALQLAAAGQIDVGEATSIAVSAMTQFHLGGSQVTHIADLLAAGADKALGSVSDLGQGLKYVGPVASSMGISIESTVGVLSELAQNGVLADQAGTSLRGVLQALTSPSKQASDVMHEYGINVFDTQGKFIGLDGVADQLQSKLAGLTESQRDAALGQIFGNAQITTATILMQGGSQAVDKWTKAVDDNGFAAEQAAGKLDSLNGDLGKLKAAFQNDLIETGQASNGVLRGLVQNATGVLEAWDKLPQPLKDVSLGLGAAASAAGLLTGGAILALPKIEKFDQSLARLGARPGLLTGGLKSTASFLTGPWGIAMAAGVGAVLLFDKATSASSKDVAALENKLITSKKSVDTYAQSLKAVTDANVLQQVNQLLGGPGIAERAGWTTAGKQLKQFLDVAGDGTNQLRNFGQDALGFLTHGFGGVQKALSTMDKALADTSGTDLPAAQKAFQDFAESQKLSADETAGALQNMPKFRDALDAQLQQLGKSTSSANEMSLAMGKLGSASSDAADDTDVISSGVGDVSQAAQDAETSVDDLAKALQGLDSGQLDASEAAVSLQQAVADATKTVTDHTEAAKKDKATADDVAAAVNAQHSAFNLSSSAGRDNQKALDDIASSALSLLGAQEKAGASTGALTKATASARDQFVDAAKKMGLSQTAAEQLADKYGLIPKTVKTTLEVSGSAAVQRQAQDVANAILSIPGRRDIQINAVVKQTGAARGVVGAAYAGGGQIVGPGGPTSDQVAILASAGEHMLTAAEVDHLGGQQSVYGFRSALDRGGIAAAAAFLDASTIAPAPKQPSSTTTTAKSRRPPAFASLSIGTYVAGTAGPQEILQEMTWQAKLG